LAAPSAAAVSDIRALSGDGYGSWDEIYADNVVWIYRLLYGKVGNRPDAEDLTTEVFLAALGPLRMSAKRAEVRAYLAKTAQSVLARYWRQRLGREATMIDVAAAERLYDDPRQVSDAAGRATRVLETLPERYRKVLELRFLEGLSIKETAHRMGVSVANAKVLQHRALRLAAGSGEGWLP
jgi:RNA polymerase sigma-70 factor (ECF subfamily)